MKYKIESVELFLEQDKVLEKYPQLADFNVTIEREEKQLRNQFLIKHIPYIEINDIEDLNRLVEALKCDVIVTGDNGEIKLMIYDGYIE